jgi:hypothetical protein
MAKQPDKQAVLLIHGIGNQQPMDTLRGFVDAVWKTDTDLHHKHARFGMWSKPDTISGSFELRRLTTSQNLAGVRTDFFEFYWAHMMGGTKVAHVVDWAKVLLVRPPGNVPPPLRGAWWILVVTILLVVGFLVYGAIPSEHQPVHMSLWVSTVISAILSWISARVLIPIVGDAARYLNPSPDNIQRRNEIRTAGVELLKRLHAEGKYRRIVIVGHSLGSVIGYDILTHSWSQCHEKHDVTTTPTTTKLTELEQADPEASIADFQTAQRHYLNELQAQGNPWLVTDFVTLGSPLTHAEILLATADRPLSQKQDDREFPTCPPTLDGNSFAFDRGKFQIPHHAAVFAPTRWTNLYFPARKLVKGDVIGGPLRNAFGLGIRDVPVQTTERKGFLSHTLYWSGLTTANGQTPEHVHQLRRAVNLLDS